MYLCSICLNLYQSIEMANICCALDFEEWQSEDNADQEERE